MFELSQANRWCARVRERSQATGRSSRPRGLSTTLIAIVLLGLSAAACQSAWTSESFRADDLSRAKVVAIAPIRLTSDRLADSSITSWMREAVYLELTERGEKYSVRIQDPADTSEAGLEADAVLEGVIVERYKTGLLGGTFDSVTKGGSDPVTDGSYGAVFTITNRADRRRVWEYRIDKAGNRSSTLETLRRTVGAKVASQFPYKK